MGSHHLRFFGISNGVCQGGILSPLLFNFYMNDLTMLLNKIPAGCCCGNIVVNHLMYADDIVLFSPSIKGLQKLVNVCIDYGNKYDIIFNALKSQSMYFNIDSNVSYPDIYLGNTVMACAPTYKYLGNIICDNLSDEEDLKSKQRLLYARSHFLMRKFYFCSKFVKYRLFSYYCSNVYLNLCSLWVKYRKVVLNNFVVAYNNSFRILLNLNKRCSASGMFVPACVRSYPEINV